MPQGPVVSVAPQTVAASTGTLDIRPANAGDEWVIHNIRWEPNGAGDIRLVWTDGSATLEWYADSAKGGWFGAFDHVTRTIWIQVQNKHASNTVKVAYDGIQTA